MSAGDSGAGADLGKSDRPSALRTGKAGPATPGKVGENLNNPAAEIWGVGKSKL